MSQNSGFSLVEPTSIHNQDEQFHSKWDHSKILGRHGEGVWYLSFTWPHRHRFQSRKKRSIPDNFTTEKIDLVFPVGRFQGEKSFERYK